MSNINIWYIHEAAHKPLKIVMQRRLGEEYTLNTALALDGENTHNNTKILLN